VPRLLLDEIDDLTAASVAGERAVEGPHFGAKSLGQGQVGGVVGRMAFKLDRDLHGPGVVGSQVEGHAERVNDRQRLGGVVGREAITDPPSGERAGNLVLSQQRRVQLDALSIPAVEPVGDRFGVGLAQDQREEDTGVDDDLRRYEARCSSSPRASRASAAASTTSD
jgi:hypothetical protein